MGDGDRPAQRGGATRVTPLGKRIAALIEANGPISIADYMAMCLFDPAHGYYTNREPFGVDGDFVTAPEISQMFGELVGAWMRHAWDELGRPSPLVLSEIGPGRGTLMRDMLRALTRVGGGMLDHGTVVLVEASPRLTRIQGETLRDYRKPIRWRTRIDDLPNGPLFIVGNEIFDALPMRQFMKFGGYWHERLVGRANDGSLHFVAGPLLPDESFLPPDAAEVYDGEMYEYAPARSALMDTIAARIAEQGGVGLFFDYGHLETGYGDTFQALRGHEKDDVLGAPGLADLTSHVDFAALAETARGHGLEVATMEQGSFLMAIGLADRARRLAVDVPHRIDEIYAAAERLAADEAMGRLFKVMVVAPPGVKLEPFPAG